MQSDIARWNRKYRDAGKTPLPEPDPVLRDHQSLLGGSGWALDAACGRGHNTAFLAGLGYRAVGVDASIEGLRLAQQALAARRVRAYLIAADLDRFVLPPERFELIVVIKYLNRPLITGLKRALRSGGLLFYRSFNLNHLEQMPSFNADYVLQPGELTTWFDDFELLASNDVAPGTESLSFALARKPDSK